MRTRAPAFTLSQARRLMPALGISRLTDITRLDRMGVPVFASIRPRGKSLRVHAGKGLRVEEAAVGALMEAVEFAVAERDSTAGPEACLKLPALARTWPTGLKAGDFAPRLGAALDTGLALPALRCTDITTRRTCLLPAELLAMPGCGLPGPGWFGLSTNGLASGNSLAEATLHALLEVLERDAVTLNRGRDGSARVNIETLPPPFGPWAAAWREQGIELIVRQVPNAFGLPCFEAFLHEAASLDVNLAAGAGLHLDRGIALARAVCEAAQSRLSLIHGGRDDITRFFAKYAGQNPAQRLHGEAQVLARLCCQQRVTGFDSVPSVPAQAVPAALRWLLAHLQGLGFGTVLRRRLGRGCERLNLRGLHVVKVVVPRCEDITTGGTRMGPRLLTRVLGGA